MNPVFDYLLQPPVLFFVLGLLAVWMRSDLELPLPLPKVLSIYLLVAIGLKGGLELGKSGFDGNSAPLLIAALAASIILPLLVFFLARTFMEKADAAAVAATYGSVSAVTFIAATTYLEQNHIAYGGHMVAALALMESPAILVGLMLAKTGSKESCGTPVTWGKIIHECTTNGSVLLLVGSFLIGWMAPGSQTKALYPFLQAAFPGVLCLFVVELGMTVARKMEALKKVGIRALMLGLLFPVVAGGAGLMVARYLGCGPGDTLLFAVLCGSGSYLAVPAALGQALPKANPGIYVTLALAITFPFNLLIGIPLAYWLVNLSA